MYSDLSIEITKFISTKEKKTEGIYFTPKSIIEKNMKLLSPYLENIKNVLEPSCGSGEFINVISDLGEYKITGIEYNKYIFDKIKDSVKGDLIHMDFLTYDTDIKYDLIIGNPPYKVVKKKDVSKEFLPFFEGRPNLFCLFILKSLLLLSKMES